MITGRGWIEGGYRYISVDGVKIAEHRHIVQQREGRKLTSNEVVHHADGNPLNNDSANLVICLAPNTSGSMPARRGDRGRSRRRGERCDYARPG